MNTENLKVKIEKYKRSVNDKYPKYADYTETNFVIIERALFEEYDCLNSTKKKIRLFCSYLDDLIEGAFINEGVKNYFKMTFDVFYDGEVNGFLLSKFDNERDFVCLMSKLKYEIVYWQGYEKDEKNKMYKLQSIVK